MPKNVHSLREGSAATGQGSERGAHFGGGAWSLYDRFGRRKYVNEEERRRFIAVALKAAPKVRTLCLTLVFTGCRISEALALTPGNVDVASEVISVVSLKKRGELDVRLVPVPRHLVRRIVAIHELRRLGIGESRRPLWPWRRTRAWQLVKGLMTEAGIVDLPASPKGLRHGFGVHAVLSGVPITLVQKWLGHEDVETTAIYTNVVGPEERAIAARMWR